MTEKLGALFMCSLVHPLNCKFLEDQDVVLVHPPFQGHISESFIGYSLNTSFTNSLI